MTNRTLLVKNLIEEGKQKTWCEYADEYNLESCRIARYYWEWHLDNIDYYEPNVEIEKNIKTSIDREDLEKENKELTTVEELEKTLEVVGKHSSLTLKSVWQTQGKGGKVNTLCSWNNDITPDDINKFREDLLEEIKEYSPIPTTYERKNTSSEKEGLLAEISFPDFHIGRVPVKKSEKLYNSTIEKTLSKLMNYNLDRIVYIVGNDWLNVDTPDYKTTRGTQQKDVDDFSTTMRAGVRIAIDSIFKLKQLEVPIDVIIIPGNHDRFRMEAVGLAIEGYFYNDDSVNVESSKKYRKYYKYGNTSFMYEHGELKARDYGPVFSTEEPKLWAESSYRYVRCGHLHHNIEEEYPGIEITFMPSLSESSDWEDSKGYISKRRGFIYLHDKIEGEVNRLQIKTDDQ